MKTTSAAMDTALAGVSLRLARCYVIQRWDGTTFRFTDHDEDIVISGKSGDETVLNGTYETVESPSPSQLKSDMALSVDNMEVQGPMALQIDVDEIDGGLFEGSDVWIFAVDWGDISADILRLRRGKIGEIKRFDDQYLFEVRGTTQRLFEEVVDLYTAFCAADLGDSECKVNLQPAAWQATTAYIVRVVKDATAEQGSPNSLVKPTTQNDKWFNCVTAGTSGGSEPTWNLSFGGTTVDGTCEWLTIRAFMMQGVVATVTSQRELILTIATIGPDAFFTGGHLEFVDGPNAGLIIEIKDWDLATKTVICSLTFPFTISPGETVNIYAGCDKRRDTCKDSWNNIRNFRGFPDIPGQDEAFRTPDAPEA